jgi:hypothetical protein
MNADSENRHVLLQHVHTRMFTSATAIDALTRRGRAISLPPMRPSFFTARGLAEAEPVHFSPTVSRSNPRGGVKTVQSIQSVTAEERGPILFLPPRRS